MMQRLTIITILFSIFLAITYCDKGRTTTELVEKFSHYKPKLDTIVSNLRSNKVLDSLFSEIGAERGIPNIKFSYPKQYKMLKTIGITDASAHEYPCPIEIAYPDEKNSGLDSFYKAHWKGKWYYFKTDWQSDYPVFLIYNECDTAKTRNGFYNKDEYQNETWGLGENWKMFRLVKEIPVKQ